MIRLRSGTPAYRYRRSTGFQATIIGRFGVTARGFSVERTAPRGEDRRGADCSAAHRSGQIAIEPVLAGEPLAAHGARSPGSSDTASLFSGGAGKGKAEYARIGSISRADSVGQHLAFRMFWVRLSWQQLQVGSTPNQFGPIRHIKFQEQIADVSLGGTDRDMENVCDLLVGQAAINEG